MSRNKLSLLISGVLLLVLSGCHHPTTQTGSPVTAEQTAALHASQDSLAGTATDQDPLASIDGRHPAQHYLKARGRGPDAARAKDAARHNLLEVIQSRLSAMKCSGPDCPEGIDRRLKTEMPPFKHGALIEVTEPLRTRDGFVALAILRRDKVIPYLMEDIRMVREKLEAWRKQMRKALREKKAGQVLDLCREDVGPLMRELEQQRLSLAVVGGNATDYTPSNDLKSVLDLQARARGLLEGLQTMIVMRSDGRDAQAASKVGRMVKELAAERGLKAQLVKGRASTAEGILITLEPEFSWSKNSFYFLRSGLSVEGRFSESQGAFLQLDIEAERSKAGGVQKAHARQDSLQKLKKILEEELGPRLPNLSCSIVW